MQNLHYIFVSGHDPGVKKWIPMHGIFFPKLMIERIRIGQYFRIKQLVQAQLAARCNRLRRRRDSRSHTAISPGKDPSIARASSSLMALTFACISLAISEAIPLTVG